jgi:uncharacterized protein YueI
LGGNFKWLFWRPIRTPRGTSQSFFSKCKPEKRNFYGNQPQMTLEERIILGRLDETNVTNSGNFKNKEKEKERQKDNIVESVHIQIKSNKNLYNEIPDTDHSIIKNYKNEEEIIAISPIERSINEAKEVKEVKEINKELDMGDGPPVFINSKKINSDNNIDVSIIYIYIYNIYRTQSQNLLI